MKCVEAIAWTPTEACILSVLADGRPHLPDELHGCRSCYGHRKILWFHISNIRRKLAPHGETIVCELHRGVPHYRHVQLLSGADAKTRL